MRSIFYQNKNNLKKILSPVNICLIAAFAVILVARFYKAAQFFSFNFDEEYQASLAWEQVKNFHPIWIGVSASNLGFYLGPGFTYLNALLFAISRGDPIILAYFSVFFGLLTTASVYFITSDIFNRKAAYIAAIIYGGSVFLNFFDRRFWNPTTMPFISIWLVYTLIKGEKDTRWYIATAFLFAAAFHVHLAIFLLTPLILFGIGRNIKKIKASTWAGMIISFIAVYSPLIVFDIVHNFDDIMAPIRYFVFHQGKFTTVSGGGVVEHWKVMVNALGKIWYIVPPATVQEEHCLGAHCHISQAPIFLDILSLGIIAWLLYLWKKGTVALRFLTVAILLYFVGFLFYPGYAAEYYLIGLYALFTIAAGVVLAYLPSTILIPGFILFLIINSYTMFTSPQEKFGLITRKKLIKETMNIVGTQPYSLETYGQEKRKYPPYGGWRFLFKIYARTPTQSFADDSFSWIYKDEVSQVKPQLRVVITDDLVYDTKDKPIASFHEGVFRSYVFP